MLVLCSFFCCEEEHFTWKYFTFIINNNNYLHYEFLFIEMCRKDISTYAKDYQAQFMLGYCSVYIFMQTFMIPGTIFLSLLAGALFGIIKGIMLVVFTATSGAASCYFLSKLIGRPLVSYLWPEKLRFFQAEVCFLHKSIFLCLMLFYVITCMVWKLIFLLQIGKRKDKLLNYMLFLRITPTLPNTFINVASPIVDIPFHIFIIATLIGIIPSTYITVRVSSVYFYFYF